MGNVLEYRGAVHKGDVIGVRELLGEPFFVRKSARCRQAVAVVKCKCGSIDVVRMDGADRKCMKCKGIESQTQNGESHSRIYKTWDGMIARCTKKNRPDFDRYGGRGIVVCEEWLNDFQAFKTWALANGYDDTLTIERKDNSGPYRPDNCCWVTNKVQSSNRRTTVHLMAFGETKTQKEWAADPRAKVHEMGIMRRLRRGMSPEEAIASPSRR